MRTGYVAPVLHCAECHAVWRQTDREQWRAHLGVDEDLEEPAEVVILCSTCADREFGAA